MKRLIFVFLMINPIFFIAQTDKDFLLEKEVATANAMSFSDPDSALLMIKKLEPKAGNTRLKSKLILAKGSAYSVKHLSFEALRLGFESLNNSQKAKDSLMIINSLGFIGNQYYILKLNRKAIDYLNKAETIINYLGESSLRQITANIFFIKGLIYKENLDPEFSIRYFDKAINAYELSRDKNSLLNINIANIQKGYSLIDIGRLNEAEAIFLQVLKNTDQEEMLEIHSYATVGLSSVYEQKKEFVEADKILVKTEASIRSTSNIGLLIEIYDALSNNSFERNNKEQYFYYNKKLEDNLLKNEEIEIKSFSDLLNKNIELQNAEFDYNNYMFLIFVFLILLLVSLCLFYIKIRLNVLKSIK